MKNLLTDGLDLKGKAEVLKAKAGEVLKQAPWRLYSRNAERVLPGNHAELLDGGEALRAMLAAIHGAQRRVLVEMYIFEEDRTGTAFRDALAARARAGVQVRVIFDAVGCLGTSRRFFRELEDAGAQVVEYHPLAPWKPYWNWIRRDHRKLLIADDTAFVGGANLCDDSAPREEGGKGWRDCVVRLEGPCMAELEELFFKNWGRGGGGDLAGSGPPYEPVGDTPVRVLSSTGFLNLHSIRRSYLQAIDRAQSSIRITNAYFLPGRSIYLRLIDAVKRGVSVRILLPHETDHPYVRWASRALFGTLMSAGIELYEYQKTVLHAKSAVIDGLWSTVGSHNLDRRSLRYNLEVNVTVYGAAFGAAMTSAFEADLRDSVRLDLKTWKDRPWTQRLAEESLYFIRYAL